MCKVTQPAYSLEIPGHPAILKNNKQIARSGKRVFVRKSNAAQMYQEIAVMHLRQQRQPQFPLTGPLNAAIITCGAWHRDSRNIPDASNLYQMPEDCLELAEIIENDRQIESHDGSRRVCLCDGCTVRSFNAKGPRKGQRKRSCGDVKHCPYECVHITLTEV